MEQLKSIKNQNMITLSCVVLGSLIAAVNLNTFVNAGGLFPGGFNGMTVLIQRIFATYFNIQLPFSPVNYALNAIPAYIGFKLVGKKFTMYSILMILLTGLFVDIIPAYNITEDILLISVFGGIVNGLSLSVALRGNASSGGMDFISMWISKVLDRSAWNYTMGVNATMLVIAGALFGWESALYSIIFQFCSTQVVNMLHTRYKRVTMFIITKQPDEVTPLVHNALHHGVTRFEGIGTYMGQPRTLLYTVVSTTDAKVLVHHIKEVDPTAFVNVTKTEFVEGRFYVAPLN